jgi:hypothetical protein
MIEKKLVERDVEVTVVEKRIVEMYNYDNQEYTKDALRKKLTGEVMTIGDRFCGGWSYSNRCRTGWDKMYKKTNSDFFIRLYKALDEKIKLIESLDNYIDKD